MVWSTDSNAIRLHLILRVGYRADLHLGVMVQRMDWQMIILLFTVDMQAGQMPCAKRRLEIEATNGPINIQDLTC